MRIAGVPKRSGSGRRLASLAALAMGILGSARAQQAPTVAESYLQRYDEVMALDAAADGVADVADLVLQRDAGRFTLTRGKLYLLRPAGGRTMGAVFHGTGVFSFSPPTKIEQDRLTRFERKPALEAPLLDVVFLFADTTLAELRRHLTFRSERAPDDVRTRVRDALTFMGDEDSKTLDPDLMSALLNGESTDLFLAHVHRQGGDPLLFMLNPHQVEAVSLRGKASRRWSQDSEIVSEFPRGGRPLDLQLTGDRTDPAEINRYVMTIDLPQSGIGDIAFAATARMDITARSPVGPGSRSSCSTSSRWIPPVGKEASRRRFSRRRMPVSSGSAWAARFRPARPGGSRSRITGT